MGKITNVTVKFRNNDRNIFKPGQVIYGDAILSVSKTAKLEAVTIKLHGICKTKWTVGSDNEKTYKEKEVYCLQELVLWGGINNQMVQLQSGKHEKEFFFQLPNNCPSSFTSKHGSINYTVELTCKLGGISSDIEFKRAIHVYDMVDLTQDAQTAELFYRPLQARGSGKDDCCFCCNKVSAKIDVTFDKSAYSPSDEILLNGFVENGSNDILPFSLTLRQHITCYGRRSDFSFTSSGNLKTKEKDVTICTWNSQPIARRSRRNFQNVASLKIPNVVATNLRNCKFISVRYYVIVKATVKGFGTIDVTTNSVNIVIGHRSLPTYDTLEHPAPSAPIPDDEPLPAYSPPTSSGDLVEVELHDNDAPPPSYFEAIANDPPPNAV